MVSGKVLWLFSGCKIARGFLIAYAQVKTLKIMWQNLQIPSRFLPTTKILVRESQGVATLGASIRSFVLRPRCMISCLLRGASVLWTLPTDRRSSHAAVYYSHLWQSRYSTTASTTRLDILSPALQPDSIVVKTFFFKFFNKTCFICLFFNVLV